MANALVAKEAQQWMEELQERSIRTALPTHVKPEHFCRIALTTLRKNPDLMKCDKSSIAAALVQSAQLGLVCDGFLGHAYLIPFKSECTLILGYKGLMELVRRSGEIASVAMESVYKGDAFSFSLGLDRTLEHIPGDNYGTDDKLITHVYVAVKLKDGTNVFDVWPRKKVEAHRDRHSKGANRPDSPWKTSFGLMGQKSVLRQMVSKGLLPVSVEVQNLVNREEYIDAKTIDSIAKPSKPSLDDLSNQASVIEDAEVVSSSQPDKGELLAMAIEDVKAATTLKGVREEFDKWKGTFDGEALDALDQATIEQSEFIRSSKQ